MQPKTQRLLSLPVIRQMGSTRWQSISEAAAANSNTMASNLRVASFYAFILSLRKYTGLAVSSTYPREIDAAERDPNVARSRAVFDICHFTSVLNFCFSSSIVIASSSSLERSSCGHCLVVASDIRIGIGRSYCHVNLYNSRAIRVNWRPYDDEHQCLPAPAKPQRCPAQGRYLRGQRLSADSGRSRKWKDAHFDVSSGSSD